MANKKSISVSSTNERTTVTARTLHNRLQPALPRQLDGIVRRPGTTASSPAKSGQPAAMPIGKMADIVRAQPQHTAPHRPQRAQTLMRRAVKKPAPGLKKHLRPQAPIDGLLPQPTQTLAVKPSVSAVDPSRELRAKSTPKSDQVRRYALESKAWFEVHKPAAIKVTKPMQPAPAKPLTHPAAKPAPHSAQRSMDFIARKLQTPVNQRPQRLRQPQAAGRKPAPATMRKPKLNLHRMPSLVIAAMAVLLLIATIAWMQRPAITLRMADAKAGFHASLPHFTPGGYTLNHYSYTTGSITVQYQRPGQAATYYFSQQSTALNDASVLTNIVNPRGGSYQTLNAGGHTIYVYGNNDAAWVADGRLYQILSNGNLSTSDVFNIASSV